MASARRLPPALLAFLLLACSAGNRPSLGDTLPDPGAPDLPATDEGPAADVPGDGDLPATDRPAGDGAQDPGTADLADPGAGDPGTADGASDPGTADAGDLGAADPGAPPVALPPDGPGPFRTATRTEEVTRGDRAFRVVAHFPLRDDGNASPLVVFLPGFQANLDLYLQTADRLASHGFVVVRAQPPGGLLDVSHVAMAADVSAVIDWAVDGGGTLAGRVDGAYVGTSGHSLGGKLSVMAAFADPRVKAVFPIDPVNGGNPLTGYSSDLPDIVPEQVATLALPLGVVGEDWSATHSAFLSPSCAPADQNYRTFYEAAAASPWKALWSLDGADHQDFVDDTDACGVTCSVCPDGPGDDDDQLAAVRTLQAAFFRRHFLGEAAMDEWLIGAKVPAEAAVQHVP